jgi:hypothetical protein
MGIRAAAVADKTDREPKAIEMSHQERTKALEITAKESKALEKPPKALEKPPKTLEKKTQEPKVKGRQADPPDENNFTAKPQRKRLNLDLSPSAYDLLQTLSNDTDKNMAEVLRTGLALYGIAHEAKKHEQELGIIDDGKIIKTIVIT